VETVGTDLRQRRREERASTEIRRVTRPMTMAAIDAAFPTRLRTWPLRLEEVVELGKPKARRSEVQPVRWRI